jgi:hypothetical protein
VEPVLNGTNPDQVKIVLTGQGTNPYPKSGCGYALKIWQSQSANLFGLAPATQSCAAASDTITPTNPISSVACNTASNTAPGIIYTGETTAPTLAQVQVVGLASLGYTDAGATAGTVDIYGGTDVRLTFSEAIDPATVTSSTVALRTGAANGSVVASTLSVSGATVVLKPNGRLAADTSYFVVVTNNVKDFAGNAMTATNRQFKTENTAPSIVSATGSWTATRTAPYGLVSITFSEPVDPSTLTGNTQAGVGSLSLRAGTTNLFGALAVDAANPKVVTWTPYEALASGTVVNVDVNPTAAATKLTDYTGAQVPAPGTPVTFTR